MKKFLLSLTLLFILPAFAFGESPADTIGISLESLSCPRGVDYKICGGVNYDLHNQFVKQMKKKNALSAIQIWDKMVYTLDGATHQGLENYQANPLIGTLAPEGITPLPERIFAKKAYKGGILYLGINSIQDADFSLYYVGYMRYKKEKNDDMIYFYNNQLVPNGSTQYNSYRKVYGDSDYTSFENDLKKSFYKGKFNNTQVNTIYQKMERSIR